MIANIMETLPSKFHKITNIDRNKKVIYIYIHSSIIEQRRLSGANIMKNWNGKSDGSHRLKSRKTMI